MTASPTLPLAPSSPLSTPVSASPSASPRRSAIGTYTGQKLNWDWRGYDIKYVAYGEGPPIVLLHGFGASIGHWRKNIPAIAAAGHRVYAIDLLGFGDSDKPDISYTLEFWVKLIHDFWKTHVQEPAIFAGNSIGALMALMTLTTYPETATGGVLLNCAGSLNHRPEDLPGSLRFVMGTFSKLVSSKLTGPFLFNRVRTKGRIRGSLKQVYGNRKAITPELIDILHSPACQLGAQQVFASILSAPPGPRPSDLLPKVTQPLLVLWGEKDPWTPISAAGIYQKLADDPQRDVVFSAISDTGHCPHDERPEIVNSLILNWIKTALPADLSTRAKS
ncbi:MAG: alpha/beta hydrolase [Leptolyngbya foveolarum]|uniref:Alpha/beta hydrolase n=1 Tax=Leptolyngbya foveolarum TaxID=47253 RepID=A0A2W4U7Z2_9CYAN|nr:MAG: alpha/beta hydrolase [Leptolyngbya foveolarum]